MTAPTAETLWSMYRTMLTIRRFEERVAKEFRTGDIPGFVHSYAGEEAVAVGVCAHLDDGDYITSTHRGHGHAIAKGCDLKDMLAELYGREAGSCRGRGGSMHIADFARGMLGANAIVGGGIAIAAGGALAHQLRGEGGVAVSFFGDGGANQGVLHETMNIASIWRLPVVFVCENNGWAESTPFSYSSSVERLDVRAAGYGMPGVTVETEDVAVVYEVAGEAIERARQGGGPTFVEAVTYRLEGHFAGDPEGYRATAEKEAVRVHDPLVHLRERLVATGAADDAALAAVEDEVQRSLDEAIEYARSSPLPDPADVAAFVYT